MAPRPGWLERLGLIGLACIEAPVLAALVTEMPLLLIGAHGTAKSLLLTRVAAALGLELRHYNASMLNFDDLVGFPLPGPNGTLDYVRTPASIWGAGAVIFDEISRCRPDIQNKMFPIIHERRVQGMALESLRHRWAAMNPPASDEDDNGYAGSEPLDAALADRFAFVVEMPGWAQFTPAQQLAIIGAQETPVCLQDARFLLDTMTRTRQILSALPPDFQQGAAQYAQMVVALLGQAGLVLSPRRAGMLYRAVLAVNAAALAMDPGSCVSDATLLALRSSVPQRAQGVAVSPMALLGAHREAMRTVGLKAHDPLRAILCTADPLRRLQLAIQASRLPVADFSTVVADALAQLAPGARQAAIAHLFETGAVGRLNAAIASEAGQAYQAMVSAPEFSEALHASHTRYAAWDCLKDLLSRLDPEDARAHLQANALASLFARRQLQTPQDAQEAFDAFARADDFLRRACAPAGFA